MNPQNFRNQSVPFKLTKLAPFIVGLSAFFFIRLLWNYSLGNGDEIYFSTGHSTFKIHEGTRQQWWDFFKMLWVSHTGRTADWLSGAVFYWGANVGKWLVSAITVLCAALIAKSTLKLSGAITGHNAWLIEITWILSVLFLFPFATLSSSSNLLLYSAAICNYLVPAALLIWSLQFFFIRNGGSVTHSLAAGSTLGIVATMHEQAAAIVLVWVAIMGLLYLKEIGLKNYLLFSVPALVGSIEMFLAPGLWAKLGTFNEATPDRPLLQKISLTFFSWNLHYSVLVIGFSILMAASVLTARSLSLLLRLSIATVSLILSVSWLYLLSDMDLQSFLEGNSYRTVSVIGSLSLLAWFIISLVIWLDHGSKIVFTISAFGVSFGLAALPGLGQIRVFNYPMLFLLSSIFLVLLDFIYVKGTQNTRNAQIQKSQSPLEKLLRLTAAISVGLMIFSSFFTARNLYVAQSENYPVGVTFLKAVKQQCGHEKCPLKDIPKLPNRTAFPGYADDNKTYVEDILAWIEGSY
ncbi:hypothetical protein BSR28_00965 [Boudabousia liubingyangii]|uniref:hypothetical protein n=1 Tax=Boudabousia liubingyangii TaxID=1921764 RepID=UPI000939F3D0|nr:hypothetical protein [Boudabousia liubingyangii]OKL48307.1 hypothetical protein BSR28_00965 [Boudabousia liubingyangii]